MSASEEIPSTSTAIRAEKFLKHLAQAQKHLRLVEHLVPHACSRTFADIETRLTQIKRFTEAGGRLQ